MKFRLRQRLYIETAADERWPPYRTGKVHIVKDGDDRTLCRRAVPKTHRTTYNSEIRWEAPPTQEVTCEWCKKRFDKITASMRKSARTRMV